MGAVITVPGMSAVGQQSVGGITFSGLTDFYVFGDRTGAGDITSSLTNRATGGGAPSVIGQAKIAVGTTSISMADTDAIITSTLASDKSWTAIIACNPSNYNAAGNGLVPFGATDSANKNGVNFQFGRSGSGGKLAAYPLNNGTIGAIQASFVTPMSPVLIAGFLDAATQTFGFWDLTTAPDTEVSEVIPSSQYNPIAGGVTVGNAQAAYAGHSAAPANDLYAFAGLNYAAPLADILQIAGKMRSILRNRGITV